nr:hypothetical protein OG999_10115 [Streptomyces sp. NBC_00886]
MLLPEGFWAMFTLILVAVMAATAVLISALTSRRAAPREQVASRPTTGSSVAGPPISRPARWNYPKAG